MILLVHLLSGALIGQIILSPILAIILAFLSHYFLDFFPHIEYSIDNITKKLWKNSKFDFLRVALDFFTGILFISIFSKNYPVIYVCAFFAILPDGLSILNSLINHKALKMHDELHQNKIHFLKNKKISVFWRIFSQIAVVVIYLILFKI